MLGVEPIHPVPRPIPRSIQSYFSVGEATGNSRIYFTSAIRSSPSRYLHKSKMSLRDYLVLLSGHCSEVDFKQNSFQNIENQPSLSQCTNCDDLFECSRIIGPGSPPRCDKCSNSLMYSILREPPRFNRTERAEVIRQYKNTGNNNCLDIKPNVNLIKPRSQPAAAEPDSAAGIVQKLRKRRLPPSVSDHGPIRMEDRHQRQLVATRDIAEGEIIIRETPIVKAPMTKDFFVKKALTSDGKPQKSALKFISICLTCCKNVQTNYRCTKCGFPMCCVTCEQHPDHADFECEIFAKNPVAPILETNEYKKIMVLRCLLLREKDPERWNQIMDMDPLDDLRASNLSAITTTIAICKFIQQECHLRQFDVATINRVVAITTVRSLNSFNISAYPVSQAQNNQLTKSTLLFYKAGILTHDCKPNTHCIITQDGKIGNENFVITVVASFAISKGQVLSTSLVDLTKGTLQRRSELLQNYYFACNCRRCMDPTEEGTFYSALKCQKCSNGKLLPGNPLSLDLTSAWHCDNAPACDFIIVNAQVQELLRAVELDVEEAAVEHSLFQEYQNLQKILAKYRSKLYSNHFYIMTIQFALIIIISQLLEVVNEELALKLSYQQIDFCSSCISIADVLRTGNNRIRGNLYYFFHEGLLLNFLGEAKRRMSEPGSNFAVTGRKHFEFILKIMKIARASLILQQPGSQEHNRALKLTLDRSGLQPLMKYFNISS